MAEGGSDAAVDATSDPPAGDGATSGGAASGVSGGAGLPTSGVERERAATGMTRPLVLPETFDGTGNWREWFFHFENVNGWDDARKLKWLRRVRLTGRAQKVCPRQQLARLRLPGMLSRHALIPIRVTRGSFRRGGRRLQKGGQTLLMTSEPSRTRPTQACKTKPVNGMRFFI